MADDIPNHIEGLRSSLNRVVEADELIRLIMIDDDPMINGLISKAQRILYETANRIQNVIDSMTKDIEVPNGR